MLAFNSALTEKTNHSETLCFNSALTERANLSETLCFNSALTEKRIYPKLLFLIQL